jgi:hypothetical protein
LYTYVHIESAIHPLETTDDPTGHSFTDERILGDYSHWAMPVDSYSKSVTLTAEILEGYYGLKEALSGKGSFAIPSGLEVMVVHVLEIILRPDTPLKVVMAGAAKVASAEHLRYVLDTVCLLPVIDLQLCMGILCCHM